MINQKINPVMGYDDIQVFVKSKTVASGAASTSHTFTPPNMSTDDIFIGVSHYGQGVFFDTDGAITNIKADGINILSTARDDVGDSVHCGIEAGKLTAPATTFTIEVTFNDPPNISTTAYFVAIRIPKSIASLYSNIIEVDANRSSSGTTSLTTTTQAGANDPILTVSFADDGFDMTVTELTDPITFVNADYSTRRILVKSTIAPSAASYAMVTQASANAVFAAAQFSLK